MDGHHHLVVPSASEQALEQVASLPKRKSTTYIFPPGVPKRHLRRRPHGGAVWDTSPPPTPQPGAWPQLNNSLYLFIEFGMGKGSREKTRIINVLLGPSQHPIHLPFFGGEGALGTFCRGGSPAGSSWLCPSQGAWECLPAQHAQRLHVRAGREWLRAHPP